jgi:hypothetical protein
MTSSIGLRASLRAISVDRDVLRKVIRAEAGQHMTPRSATRILGRAGVSVVLAKPSRRLMAPEARSTDLPHEPDAPRAAKELPRTLLRQQLRERRYRQISRTRWTWCGLSGAGTVAQ